MVSVQAKARGNDFQADVEVQNLDTTLVQPSGYEVKGKLNGRATLSGTPRAPILNGNFTLASGQIQEVNIKALSATINYSS